MSWHFIYYILNHTTKKLYLLLWNFVFYLKNILWLDIGFYPRPIFRFCCLFNHIDHLKRFFLTQKKNKYLKKIRLQNSFTFQWYGKFWWFHINLEYVCIPISHALRSKTNFLFRLATTEKNKNFSNSSWRWLTFQCLW